jgi:DNA mismatch endonuclease (patch repair protein)
MTDVFSPKKRSEIMAANKGRGNKATEIQMRELLTDAGIEGWESNPPDVSGKPDFIFRQEKIALFVDGCFWHGCDTCRNIPANNHEFWLRKINRTKARDKEVTKLLKTDGWKVIRIWEHELKKKNNPKLTIRRIRRILRARSILVPEVHRR